jgi:predicted nucleic acid-binding protein
MALFLDTSFVIALEMARDNHHKAAAQYWQSYIQNPQPLVTTDLVFAEIVTFFNARGLHQKAVEVGDRLVNSQLVEIVSTTPELRKEAWAFFKRHADKQYSLADCASFIVMRKRRIHSALTFDDHFAQAGLTVVPAQ